MQLQKSNGTQPCQLAMKTFRNELRCARAHFAWAVREWKAQPCVAFEGDNSEYFCEMVVIPARRECFWLSRLIQSLN